MGTDTGSLSGLTKPIAKDSFRNRMIERLIWTAVSVILLKFGVVLSNGFVIEAGKAEAAEVIAVAATEEKYEALSAFSAYVVDRLARDQGLEPLIIHCLAEHPTGARHPPAEDPDQAFPPAEAPAQARLDELAKSGGYEAPE